MFPLVFVYVTEPFIASPPDKNVTVGVAIASLAVNVRVITSFALARVVVALLDAILTLLKVGEVLSNITLPEPLVTAVPATLLVSE